MEFFAKINIKFNLLTISAKTSILDVWQGCEYASEMFHKSFQIIYSSCFFFMWKTMFTVTHFYVLSNQATHVFKYFLKRGVQSTCSIGSLMEDIAFLAWSQCSLFWNWMFYRSSKKMQKETQPNFSNEFRTLFKRPIFLSMSKLNTWK